jgi:hypothetical protein
MREQTAAMKVKKGGKVKTTYVTTLDETVYSSKTGAARALGICLATVDKWMKDKKLYKSYYFSTIQQDGPALFIPYTTIINELSYQNLEQNNAGTAEYFDGNTTHGISDEEYVSEVIEDTSYDDYDACNDSPRLFTRDSGVYEDGDMSVDYYGADEDMSVDNYGVVEDMSAEGYENYEDGDDMVIEIEDGIYSRLYVICFITLVGDEEYLEAHVNSHCI